MISATELTLDTRPEDTAELDRIAADAQAQLLIIFIGGERWHGRNGDEPD